MERIIKGVVVRRVKTSKGVVLRVGRFGLGGGGRVMVGVGGGWWQEKMRW